MKIARFSVSKYRSITNSTKINLKERTVLIGANNEGKSNFLRSMNIGLRLIKQYSIDRPVLLNRISRSRMSRRVNIWRYFWEDDFPIDLRDSKKAIKKSKFSYDFDLDADDVAEFEKLTKSKNNGKLSVSVEVGEDNKPVFTVIKSGKVGNYKKAYKQIASFISDRISIIYIPAVRTEQESVGMIQEMISHALVETEKEENYLQALNVIESYQKPILERLQNEICDTLGQFIPDVIEVKLDASYRRISSAVRSDVEMIINDGNPTSLEYKGDGIKSLVALSLFRHQLQNFITTIVAIEEPEAHLHPGAMKELRDVLFDMASESQIIIATHSALFVDSVSNPKLIE